MPTKELSKKTKVTAKIIGLKKSQIEEQEANTEGSVGDGNYIEPWLTPKQLYSIYTDSSLLPPNVTAMSANIDGLGHRFESIVKLQSNNTEEKIREAIFSDYILVHEDSEENELNKNRYYEKLGKSYFKKVDGEEIGLFSPDDIDENQVEETKNLIENMAMIEKIKAKSFFKNCVVDKSFEKLRKLTRNDLEICGNAYWEVIRIDGKIKYFKRIKPERVRISYLSKTKKSVKIYERISDLTTKEKIIKKNVRSFRVKINGDDRYFKSFGVQEVINNTTGKYYQSLKTLKAHNKRTESKDKSGNEILHFKILENINEPYGTPRWHGAIPELLGSHGSSVYNARYFEEGILDPMVVSVTGGSLAGQSEKVLEDYLKGMKGADNSHKLLLLEAVSPDGKVVPEIKFESLKKNNNTSDAGWLKYDSRNEDKVGAQFRLPKIVKGLTTGDYNRATSDNAMKQADEQVFEPERRQFDWEITRFILPELGLTSIEFVSNGIDSTDNELLGDLVDKFVNDGIITPAEGREIVEKIFSIDLPIIDEDWVNYPQKLLMAGLVGNIIAPTTGNPEVDKEIEKRRNEIRKYIVKYQGEQAEKLQKEKK
jgi:capsid portal protein